MDNTDSTPLVPVPEKSEASKKAAEELLDRARKRHARACDADRDQRERELKALRFQVPDEQWDPDARAQREGNAAAGIPARPILTIPKIDQPIQLILNQERTARLGVNVSPSSPTATTEIAEFFEGHYRAIERESQAHDARAWAFERAVKVGRGYYRVNTTWDDSTEDPWDQKIQLERIFDQSCVHFDPSAQQVDNSDAEYVFLDRWMSAADFKRQYPTATFSASESFGDESQSAPDWLRSEGDDPAILVVEYFWKDHEFEEIQLEVEGEPAPRVRKMDKVRVRWATLTAHEVLEQQHWNGQYLPIITIVGKELQPFDGRRQWQGMIEPAMGAQKIQNYAASQAVEAAALEPKAPFVMAEGQDEGYEAMWAQANVRNFPALKYKPVTIGGQAVPAPARAQVDGSRMNLSMQLLQMSDNWIQSSTATYDPALGRQNPREKSGRAILALQQQSETGNSHYLNNLARAMEYEAKVVLDLMPAIYDRPGRVVRTLDNEDKTSEVMVNQPFFKHPKTGRPVPAITAQGQPPMLPPLPLAPGQGAPEIKTLDMRQGVYSVSVSIGKAANTLRQESQEAIGEILASAPQLMPIIGPVFFERADFPGHEEIAEVLRKMREKQYPGLFTDKEDGPSPEQAQAQIQGLKGQVQGMQQQLQAAVQEIKTKQAEQAAKIDVAQIEAAARIKVAEVQAAAGMAVKGVVAKLDMLLEMLQLQHKDVERRETMAHEAAMSAADAETAAASQQSDQDYQAEMAAAEPVPQSEGGM